MGEAASAREIREFKDGEVILEEGERNTCFWVILNGAVQLSQDGKAVRTLTDGDIFGLEAHFLDKPSSLRARAAAVSRIAAYGHEVVNDILYSRPQMTERILVSLLGQLEQTTQLAREGLEGTHATDVDMCFLEDGDVLFREGDPGDAVYKLVSTEGGLRLTRNGQEFGSITQPNRIFGEMSGLLKQRRTATATSVGRSVIQVYRREQIEQLVEENPAFARRLIEQMAARLVTPSEVKLIQ